MRLSTRVELLSEERESMTCFRVIGVGFAVVARCPRGAGGVAGDWVKPVAGFSKSSKREIEATALNLPFRFVDFRIKPTVIDLTVEYSVSRLPGALSTQHMIETP